jgi:protein ImuB
MGRAQRTNLPVRTLVVWCPDWPVAAAGAAPDEPAAVLFANRVMAASPAARAEGVVPGLRRREAQARCPALAVLDHDPARDARAFEPVVVALEALTPRIEISEPGRCGFPTRGPSRYFGGDDAVARRAAELAEGVVPAGWPVRVGVADGRFAATVAAHRASATLVIPVGGGHGFLAPLPLTLLDVTLDPGADRRPLDDLVDVLGRLGLRTLGELAALPMTDVVARFGALGAAVHRLAAGDDPRPPATRPPPPEFAVAAEFDPPAERAETAAFMARPLADELHQRLAERGLACTRVVIVAETENGERTCRLWRHEGALSAGAVADRVRWQLDGWLQSGWRSRPTAGITLLRLVPDEVTAATGRQLGFWGGSRGADERVVRAVARLQGLLGFDAVTVPEWRGGRAPGERVALVPAAGVDLDPDRPAARSDGVDAPWPGRLPDPSPAVVHDHPLPAELVDEAGGGVGVSGRSLVSGAPARLAVNGGAPRPVVGWAGPWPADERWWDPAHGRRRARFQVETDDGVARLVTLEGGAWHVEATYD